MTWTVVDTLIITMAQAMIVGLGVVVGFWMGRKSSGQATFEQIMGKTPAPKTKEDPYEAALRPSKVRPIKTMEGE